MGPFFLLVLHANANGPTSLFFSFLTTSSFTFFLFLSRFTWFGLPLCWLVFKQSVSSFHLKTNDEGSFHFAAIGTWDLALISSFPFLRFLPALSSSLSFSRCFLYGLMIVFSPQFLSPHFPWWMNISGLPSDQSGTEPTYCVPLTSPTELIRKRPEKRMKC